MIEKATDVTAPVHELILNRWSGVSFDPHQTVSKEDLRTMAEAARWAPSCFGDQPWRVIFCNRNYHEDAWRKAYECLGDGNKPWCIHAPVLAIICADTKFSKNEKDNAWGEYDTGAAALSICLQARHLDIMTHQMAGFSAEKARETFAIPERFTPKAMMAIGYQLPEDEFPEEFKERELKPRERHPVEELFYLDEWGKGF